MKPNSFYLICISLFCFPVFAQSKQTLPCPKIELTGPATVTVPGDTLTFSANVTSESSLNYNWTISAGTIVEGQNSPVVRVATTPEMVGLEVKATVEIKGLPENCANSASETAVVVNRCGLLIELDDYGKISFKEEKERLKNVAANLTNQLETSAYIFMYFPANQKPQQDSYTKKIKDYLTQTLKISAERLIFLYGEDKIQRTRIVIVPNGALKEQIK